MPHTSIKIPCETTQFLVFSFCSQHAKPHRVSGLIKHYHLLLDPKLGHCKCAIRQMTCDFISCTTILDKPRSYSVDPTKQYSCQPVVECTYWRVLVFFNNWNIIQFTNKTTSSEDFDSVHKVVIDIISGNKASLVQLRKYGAVNVQDPTHNRVLCDQIHI